MKENLEIEEPELVKTFSFSVNDTYSVPVIGKTYSSVKRNETLPDFTGSSISYLESWASSRSIVIEKNMVEDNSCVDSSVISQNIHSGTLVSSVSNLKVDVCKNVVVNTVTENSNDDSNSNISASNSSSSNSDTSISNSDDQNNDIDEVIESLVN
jgi:beta-lactam-binding protein with PASTA domain